MKHRLRKCLAVCLVLALSASLLSFGAAEGVRRLTLYWTDEGVDYETCDVWIWFPGKDGSGHLFEPCEYGGKTSVDVPEDVSEVGFIVRRDCSEPGGSSWGNATKDYDGDRFAVLTGSLTENDRLSALYFTARVVNGAVQSATKPQSELMPPWIFWPILTMVATSMPKSSANRGIR